MDQKGTELEQPYKNKYKKGSIQDRVRERLSQSSFAFYIGSSLAGIMRTLIGFPIEHPIDSIKTQWQAKPYMKHEVAIIRDIYHYKGMKGFYAGALPNMARCIMKNSYRYPLMVGLPGFYRDHLPQSIKEHRFFTKLLTGSSIALIEATLTCPVERLKVYFMTNTEKMSYKQFFKNYEGNLFKELFRGFTPLFIRQSMAWVVFLEADLLVKHTIRKMMNIPKSTEIPTKYLIPASFVVALINTSMVMPLDCVKTHMEKVDPTQTYLNCFRVIYSQGGFLGFFTGFRLRFLLYLTNALFIVNLLEKLENIANFLKHNKK